MRDYRDINLQGRPFLQVVKQYKLLALEGKRRPLVRVDLSNANLRGVDLADLAFVDANFEGSDLSMANLSKTDFMSTNLARAIMVDANLSGAVFQACNFRRANLRGANLGNTSFDDVNFCGADLQRVKLLATIMVRVTHDADTAWPSDIDRSGFL